PSLATLLAPAAARPVDARSQSRVALPDEPGCGVARRLLGVATASRQGQEGRLHALTLLWSARGILDDEGPAKLGDRRLTLLKNSPPQPAQELTDDIRLCDGRTHVVERPGSNPPHQSASPLGRGLPAERLAPDQALDLRHQRFVRWLALAGDRILDPLTLQGSAHV